MTFVQVFPQAPRKSRTIEFNANNIEEAKKIALKNFRGSQYMASMLYVYGKTDLKDCLRTFTALDLNIDTRFDGPFTDETCEFVDMVSEMNKQQWFDTTPMNPNDY